MKTIRNNVTIKGVKVEMLFTPRLFEFKTESMDFTDSASAAKVAGMYADIAYCAALNLWTLEDKAVDDYPLKRVDFHEWASLEPSEFGKTMRIALEALTNKSVEELMKDNASKKDNAQPEVKKKKSLSITQRLRLFWLAIVG